MSKKMLILLSFLLSGCISDPDYKKNMKKVDIQEVTCSAGFFSPEFEEAPVFPVKLDKKKTENGVLLYHVVPNPYVKSNNPWYSNINLVNIRCVE